MKGLSLGSFTDELHRVASDFEKNPIDAIPDLERKASKITARMCKEWGSSFCFKKQFHSLSIDELGGFTFDDLCKLRHSTIFTMDRSVNELFESEPQYELVRKIVSSMWRWGIGEGAWNEIVDAYDAIRRFSLPNLVGFEARLDHTRAFNPRGWSKHGEIFLDGVFAFLLHYKGEHVFTIGFSVMAGRRILLQQVQSAKRTGNRALYRLPQNRIEWAISLFKRCFPDYAISVIDGAALGQRFIDECSISFSEAAERLERYAERERTLKSEESASFLKSSVERSRKEWESLRIKIAHLKHDLPRLTSFYANAGQFVLDPAARIVNGLAHHDVR